MNYEGCLDWHVVRGGWVVGGLLYLERRCFQFRCGASCAVPALPGSTRRIESPKREVGAGGSRLGAGKQPVAANGAKVTDATPAALEQSGDEPIAALDSVTKPIAAFVW